MIEELHAEIKEVKEVFTASNHELQEDISNIKRQLSLLLSEVSKNEIKLNLLKILLNPCNIGTFHLFAA